MSVVGQVISLLESGAKTVRFETKTSVYELTTGVSVDSGSPDFTITKVEIKPGMPSPIAAGVSKRGDFLGTIPTSEGFGLRLSSGSVEGSVQSDECRTSTVIKVH